MCRRCGSPNAINKKLEALGSLPPQEETKLEKGSDSDVGQQEKSITPSTATVGTTVHINKRLDPTFIMPGFDLLDQECPASKKIQEFSPHT
jgi:hypothetical protein